MKQFEYKVIAPAVNLALTTRQYEQQAQELEKLLNTCLLYTSRCV